MKKSKRLGILSLLFGIAIVLDSNIGITGYFIAEASKSTFGNILGLAFIVVGVGLLMAKHLENHLEVDEAITNEAAEQRKIILTSSIKKYPNLVRLAKRSVNDESVYKEMNHLIKELSRGNLQAGLGTPGHIDDTSIDYLRGRNGARLYYTRTPEGYETVGKSSKANQSTVIRALKKIYSK